MFRAAQTRDWRRLQIPKIEKAFAQIVIELRETLVLDGIDASCNPPAFRVRCHDPYGPLPDTTIEGTGETYPVLDHVIRAAAKLMAVAHVRREITGLFPAGAEFMLPTSTDNGSLVGIRWESRTYLAEGSTLLEAYHGLRQKIEESG
jgi:serine protease inhibitor ecotin